MAVIIKRIESAGAYWVAEVEDSGVDSVLILYPLSYGPTHQKVVGEVEVTEKANLVAKFNYGVLSFQEIVAIAENMRVPVA